MLPIVLVPIMWLLWAWGVFTDFKPSVDLLLLFLIGKASDCILKWDDADESLRSPGHQEECDQKSGSEGVPSEGEATSS